MLSTVVLLVETGLTPALCAPVSLGWGGWFMASMVPPAVVFVFKLVVRRVNLQLLVTDATPGQILQPKAATGYVISQLLLQTADVD